MRGGVRDTKRQTDRKRRAHLDRQVGTEPISPATAFGPRDVPPHGNGCRPSLQTPVSPGRFPPPAAQHSHTLHSHFELTSAPTSVAPGGFPSRAALQSHALYTIFPDS